jgi:hypothetical protein
MRSRARPLAVLVPVLARPQNVVPLVESVREATPQLSTLLFIASPGDEAELAELERAGVEYVVKEGNYATKINEGAAMTTEPYLFTGADDLRFYPGWFEAAFEKMLVEGVEVVGTQDLCNPRVIAGEHATHFVVTRHYYEQWGTVDERPAIFHEGYPHEYVDDELIGTAKMRELYAFAGDSVVEHLHPLAGKAPTDALYEASAKRMRAGRPLFERRRRLWENPAL